MDTYTFLDIAPGSVLLCAGAAGLRAVRLTRRRGREARRLAERSFTGASYEPGMMSELQDQLRGYFAGEHVEFDVDVDLAPLTPFQRRVLRACAELPYGRTVTYAELAKSIGRPKAYRAVGNALARNPVPIVIPCHRVLGSGGSLGGFSAEQGTALKRWLLDLESRVPFRPGISYGTLYA